MWLYVRFPLLLLDRDLGTDADANQAQALLGQGCIIEVNRAAQAAGVRPGQSLSTARSLCPELQCRTPCPQRMRRQLEQLALWAYRFTPEVSLSPPAGLLLNVAGSLKLFHGFMPLYRRFRWGFRKRRIPTVYGLGHSPLAAELISFSGKDICCLLNEQGLLDERATVSLLDSLSIKHLPCENKQREQLLTMGLKTLGTVNKLPGAALTRRFGHQFSSLFNRLYGREADLRPSFQPPDHFYSERQFNGSLTRTAELRFPIAALLDELEHFLQLKQWVNRHLDWQFRYCDATSEQLSMAVSHQHFDRRRLLQLVLLKLEKFTLRGPVDALALQCHQFESIEQRNSELFRHSALFDPQRQERYLAVLDKLTVRLGADSFWHPGICNEHLPEQAIKRSQPLAASSAPRSPAAITSSAIKPAWLMQAPLRLSEVDGRPCWHSPLQLLQGPERIDSQWWQQRQVRDYYIARTDKGALCWVYRDCLQQHWYLHGLFG